MSDLKRLVMLCIVVAVEGCAGPASDRPASRAGSETVLITYHVISGREQELTNLLAKAWDVYTQEKLVFAEPHVVVKDLSTAGQPRILEIFTWVSSSAPDHAPQSVKKLWEQMQACCERQNGGQGLEGGAVELLAPKPG